MCCWQRIYRGRKKNNGPCVSGRRAFTLIELLITATIFSVVSLAVYATFNSGMSIWRRVKDASMLERMVLLKIEKLSRELRQTFNFQDIAFIGSKEQIEFPQIIDSDISRVTYKLGPDNRKLFRIQVTLKDLLGEKEPVVHEGVVYLSGIEKIDFSYFYFDLEKNSYSWKESWQGPGLPLAVKINISNDAKTYATTIFIPTA